MQPDALTEPVQPPDERIRELEDKVKLLEKRLNEVIMLLKSPELSAGFKKTANEFEKLRLVLK